MKQMLKLFTIFYWTKLAASACSFPPDLTGNWLFSLYGDMVAEFADSDTLKIPYNNDNIELNCLEETDGHYIMLSGAISYSGFNIYIGICIEFKKISPDVYLFTHLTAKSALAENQRVSPLFAPSATKDDVCTELDNKESYLMVRKGGNFFSDCPPEFRGMYSFTFTTALSCSASNLNSDFCYDSTVLNFNPDQRCSSLIGYSATGQLRCIYNYTVGKSNINRLFVYNMDTSTNEKTTFRFVCLVYTKIGSTLRMTQNPRYCDKTQTSLVPLTIIDLTEAKGAAFNGTMTTCPKTEAPTTTTTTTTTTPQPTTTPPIVTTRTTTVNTQRATGGDFNQTNVTTVPDHAVLQTSYEEITVFPSTFLTFSNTISSDVPAKTSQINISHWYTSKSLESSHINMLKHSYMMSEIVNYTAVNYETSYDIFNYQSLLYETSVSQAKLMSQSMGFQMESITSNKALFISDTSMSKLESMVHFTSLTSETRRISIDSLEFQSTLFSSSATTEQTFTESTVVQQTINIVDRATSTITKEDNMSNLNTNFLAESVPNYWHSPVMSTLVLQSSFDLHLKSTMTMTKHPTSTVFYKATSQKLNTISDLIEEKIASIQQSLKLINTSISENPNVGQQTGEMYSQMASDTLFTPRSLTELVFATLETSMVYSSTIVSQSAYYSSSTNNFAANYDGSTSKISLLSPSVPYLVSINQATYDSKATILDQYQSDSSLVSATRTLTPYNILLATIYPTTSIKEIFTKHFSSSLLAASFSVSDSQSSWTFSPMTTNKESFIISSSTSSISSISDPILNSTSSSIIRPSASYRETYIPSASSSVPDINLQPATSSVRSMDSLLSTSNMYISSSALPEGLLSISSKTISPSSTHRTTALKTHELSTESIISHVAPGIDRSSQSSYFRTSTQILPLSSSAQSTTPYSSLSFTETDDSTPSMSSTVSTTSDTQKGSDEITYYIIGICSVSFLLILVLIGIVVYIVRRNMRIARDRPQQQSYSVRFKRPQGRQITWKKKKESKEEKLDKSIPFDHRARNIKLGDGRVDRVRGYFDTGYSSDLTSNDSGIYIELWNCGKDAGK